MQILLDFKEKFGEGRFTGDERECERERKKEREREKIRGEREARY